MFSVQVIRNDLELCEDRLSSLEIMCNHLSNASGFLDTGVISDLKRQLASYVNQLELFKKDFDRLPDVAANPPVQDDECEMVQRKKSFTKYGFTDETTSSIQQIER